MLTLRAYNYFIWEVVGILKCTTTDTQNETVQLGRRKCPEGGEGRGVVDVLFLCQPRKIFRIIKMSVFFSHFSQSFT